MSFRARLSNRETLIGTLLQQPLPALAEICADAGFDWLFLDMEHGALELRDVERILQAVNDRCPCVVRVPNNDRVWIGRGLDLGAAGIIVPQVNSAAEAQRAVHAAKYPPVGGRGVGGGRAFGYGARAADYLQRANESTAVIIQFEHADAIQNAHAIAEVAGVDALLIGPNDLAASMGHLGETEHSEVRAAIAEVRELGLTRKMPMGIFYPDAERARRAQGEGFTLLVVGTDNGMLVSAAQAIVRALKAN